MRARILVLALVMLAPLPIAASAAAASERSVVLLVFDGVAPVLLDSERAPTFARLRREGSWSHALEPVFPTISLINGFSLSTGCWPAQHGIVSNMFLDPERGLYDHARDADWLTGCEGLHQAAERQGVRTAALDWYGGRSSSRGDLASLVRSGPDESVPDDATQAEHVADLLALPGPERPRLILAYFRGPDWSEHISGIDSEQTREAVRSMDAAVARVLAAIEASARPTALLIATDHGMREVSRIVNVRRLLHWHDIDATPVSTGTTSFLYFDDPTGVEAAHQALAGYDQFEVFRGDDLPPYARLGNGPRVPQLLISAHPPYFIEDTALWPRWLRWLSRWGPRFVWARPFLKATHGYPPDTPGMSGVFYAWGDGVRAGRELPGLRAVDVHPTATRLLGIAPGRPVDGVGANLGR